MAATTNNNNISNDTMMDDALATARKELAELRKKGEQQRKLHAVEMQMLEYRQEEAQVRLGKSRDRMCLSSYKTEVSDVFSHDNIPPYVQRNQTILCHALHKVEVFVNQMRIIQEDQDVIQYLQRESSEQNDENARIEKELMNKLALAAIENGDIRASFENILAKQEEQLQNLRESETTETPCVPTTTTTKSEPRHLFLALDAALRVLSSSSSQQGVVKDRLLPPKRKSASMPKAIGLVCNVTSRFQQSVALLSH